MLIGCHCQSWVGGGRGGWSGGGGSGVTGLGRMPRVGCF